MVTYEQSEVIDLIIQGRTIVDIAKTLGINRQTVYNWLAKDEVKAELSARQGDIRGKAKNKIMSKVDRYIQNLQKLATSSNPNVALAANKYLLDRILGSVTSETKIEKTESVRKEVDKNELKEKFQAKLKAVK